MNEHLLFQSFQLGHLKLANRIVMAPLTRSRAGRGDVPTDLNAQYYSQRATAGLIITEATQISHQAKGYAFTPGMYSPEQITGWRLTTEAVHAKGGHIFAQLWHVGRISHPDLQPNGNLPVAPSAIKPAGDAFTETGLKPFVTPRALETHEIPGIVAQYIHAAQYAKNAGFDGIEIHAANGYLLDQFMRDSTNERQDTYGGSIENRVRLTLEVIEAVTKVWHSKSVGIRLSPVNPANDIQDSNPMATFSFLVEQLNRYHLGYIHCVEGATRGEAGPVDFSFQRLRQLFQGTYIANNGYSLQTAIDALDQQNADLVAFGRLFIGNPDLVERFKSGAPCVEAPRETWYGGGAKGYVDWPMLIK